LRHRPPPRSPPFPYTTLFRSPIYNDYNCSNVVGYNTGWGYGAEAVAAARNIGIPEGVALAIDIEPPGAACPGAVNVDGASRTGRDRKSTRLNSSHVAISYAVF